MRVHSEGDKNSKTLRLVAQKLHTISFSPFSQNYQPNSAKNITDFTFVNLSPDRRLSNFRNISKVILTWKGEFFPGWSSSPSAIFTSRGESCMNFWAWWMLSIRYWNSVYPMLCIREELSLSGVCWLKGHYASWSPTTYSISSFCSSSPSSRSNSSWRLHWGFEQIAIGRRWPSSWRLVEMMRPLEASR